MRRRHDNQITELYVVSRRNYNDPFHVRYVLHLGTGDVTPADDSHPINVAIDEIPRPQSTESAHDKGPVITPLAPEDHETVPAPQSPDKKPRMRTAEDVMKRIRWDSAQTQFQWLIGYYDSSCLGIREVTMEEWDYNKPHEIPMHR